jgi:hypothetical protein
MEEHLTDVINYLETDFKNEDIRGLKRGKNKRKKDYILNRRQNYFLNIYIR